MSVISNIPPTILIQGNLPPSVSDEPPIEDFKMNWLMDIRTVEEFNQFVAQHPDCNVNSSGVQTEEDLYQKLLPLIDAHLKQNPSLVRKGFHENGASYMAWSAQKGKQVVRIFLENGADVNCTLSNGITALHISSCFKIKEVTRFLLLTGGVLYQAAREKALSEYAVSRYPDAEFMANGIRGQISHIQRVIQEIRKEWAESFGNFKKLLRANKGQKKTYFDRFPKELGAAILDFTPNYHLQTLFIKNNSLG